MRILPLLFAALCLAALPAMAEDTLVQPPSRDVTPPEMTPGPKVDSPLPREPVPPAPPAAARWQRFFLPLTNDAATFVVEKKTIHIAGVEPPPVAATCPVEGSEPWPCGRLALTSLRMFLRGRAVECYFPPDGNVVDITAPCRVGTSDIGLWLLSEGWARPNDLATDQYRDATHGAVCAKRGIWREQKPDTDCPKVGGAPG
jgi:endonuclease YncB( thermonuclease family)